MFWYDEWMAIFCEDDMRSFLANKEKSENQKTGFDISVLIGHMLGFR